MGFLDGFLNKINFSTTDEYDGDYDDIKLKDRYLEAVLGECGLDYVGWTLGENDLTNHNLAELREMLSKEIESEYKVDMSPNNLIFEFGEIYR